ncbi:PAS domain-containing protein, partial [uncultured Xanthomonas sp.]|uniref:PAS domain-containing protein n=1 Tax=uncultured Xanthomonas sp. TaxID=152831 RepID=UPI0026003B91
MSNQRSDIFFAAVQTTRMPMIVTDPRQPDNPIIFVNRAFLEMTGYGREELIGNNCRFLQGPDTDRETVRSVRDAITSHDEVAVEILNYRKDGSSFWNALYISPVYDDRGELVYFFGSQLDVSRRRDAEDALRQAQKMEALGQLTGGIAHDFNNMLQGITGAIEVMRRRVAKGHTEGLDRFMDSAAQSATRAASLVQRLLAFSRRQSLDPRPIDVNRLVRSMEEMLRRTLGEHVRLAVELDSEACLAIGDESQLESAILNLAINARDAMPEGGNL